jgi:hypothetical protein
VFWILQFYTTNSSEATVLQPTALPHRYRLAIPTAWNHKYGIRKSRRVRTAVFIIHTREMKCKKSSVQKSEEGIGRRITLQKVCELNTCGPDRPATNGRGSIILDWQDSIGLRKRFESSETLRHVNWQMFTDISMDIRLNMYWHFDGYETKYLLIFRWIPD